MKKIAFLSIVLIFLGCGYAGDPEGLKKAVREFDGKYKDVINGIIDSLSKNLGTNSDYVMEYRPRARDIYFRHPDRTGTGLVFFDNSYHLTPEQESFMIDAKTPSIWFSEKPNKFSMKLFLFKMDDKTVWLSVYPKGIVADEIQDSVVLKAEGRVYTISDAWQ